MARLLAVIDYQNDFVTGALGFEGAAEIDDGIAHLAQSYLAQGDHVLSPTTPMTTHILTPVKGRRCPSRTATRPARAGSFTARRRNYAVRLAQMGRYTRFANTRSGCRQKSW